MDTIFSEQQERFKRDNAVSHEFLKNKCQCFNSSTHWWIYWDKETGKTYDQYGYPIGNDDFLIKEGLIDSDKNIIKTSCYE